MVGRDRRNHIRDRDRIKDGADNSREECKVSRVGIMVLASRDTQAGRSHSMVDEERTKGGKYAASARERPTEMETHVARLFRGTNLTSTTTDLVAMAAFACRAYTLIHNTTRNTKYVLSGHSGR
jgi:hypothetical protein